MLALKPEYKLDIETGPLQLLLWANAHPVMHNTP